MDIDEKENISNNSLHSSKNILTQNTSSSIHLSESSNILKPRVLRCQSQSTKTVLPFKIDKISNQSNQSSMVLNDSVSTNNTISSLSLSKSKEEDLFLIPDVHTMKDMTQFAVDYIQEIYANLLIDERNKNPKKIAGFMERQNEINAQMRSILIDWLIDVHLRFKLRATTLFFTVRIIDNYLYLKLIQRCNFQLLGIAALLIASKHEEIYIPKLDDLIYVTDNAYKKEELVQMEEDVLDILKFDILSPSPLDFYQIIAKSFSFKKKHYYLGRFFMESFLLDINYTCYSPSVIACACAYIVMKYYKIENYQRCYDKRLTSEGASQEEIKSVAKEMCFFIDNLNKTELKGAKNKFSLSKYEQVALECNKE